MGFDSVAKMVAEQKWKARPDGQGEGQRTQLYFQRPVLERLRKLCDERGISVSRYLQTRAMIDLGMIPEDVAG